jgi:DNA ligase-1
MKIVYQTPTLIDNKKHWVGQVLQDKKKYYTRTETWRILANGSESKHLLSEPFLIEGKNVGRSNETTPLDQAMLEIQRQATAKKDKGYVIPGEKSKILPLPMLAHKFGDRKHNITFPAYAQPKYNGMRMLYDGTRAWSRGGKFIIPEVIQHLAFDTDGYITDGELMLPEMPILQETIKAAKKYRKGLSDRLVYVIYDLVLQDAEFKDRVMRMRSLHMKNASANPQIIFAPSVKVHSESEIYKIHDEWIKMGFEGTMVRNAEGLYTINKRSHDLLKLKNFQDAEFVIVDVIDGGGKDTGHAIFVCETSSGERFNCRPEGSMESRAMMFKNKKRYIGKWLTIRFAELTKDGVPQFPVGVVVRDVEDFS